MIQDCRDTDHAHESVAGRIIPVTSAEAQHSQWIGKLTGISDAARKYEQPLPRTLFAHN